MKRCAGCGSVRDRRGMDCLEDGSWRCCDCIKSKPVVDGLIAMNACLVQLDMLVAESGRGVEWGEEDAFRMGEWFEDTDLANIEKAKAFVAGLSRATPSSAGTVSVEAAARPMSDIPEDGTWALLYPGYYGPVTACVMNGEWSLFDEAEKPHVTHWVEIQPALRALAGEGVR